MIENNLRYLIFCFIIILFFSISNNVLFASNSPLVNDDENPNGSTTNPKQEIPCGLNFAVKIVGAKYAELKFFSDFAEGQSEIICKAANSLPQNLLIKTAEINLSMSAGQNKISATVLNKTVAPDLQTPLDIGVYIENNCIDLIDENTIKNEIFDAVGSYYTWISRMRRPTTPVE